LSEPRCLTSEKIRVAYERQRVRFAEPAGLRDENALEPALARLIYRWRYGETDLVSLARGKQADRLRDDEAVPPA
jgi:hypothetical protein